MKAFALSSSQAAIATPARTPSSADPGLHESVSIVGGGAVLCFTGKGALQALRQAIDHALGEEKPEGGDA